MAELANLMYMTNCTKQCPNKVCKARIQKSSGCNKMQCGSCKTKFCWNCSKIIDSYAHFDESPECQLYTPVHLDGDLENNEEYKRAEQQMQNKIDKLLEAEDQNFIFCPTCNTINERGHINDIECTNC